METSVKHKIRIAQVLREQLLDLRQYRLSEVLRLTGLVGNKLEMLLLNHRKLQGCQQHKWSNATAKLSQGLENNLRDLPFSIDQTLRMMHNCQFEIPTLRQLVEELTQLEQEFGRIECNLKKLTLSVFTEPVELEGIYLGDFEIRLEIASLHELRDCGIFRIAALDPHPAAGNEGVTHPHVNDEYLCAGDAGNSLLQALAAGRICDAFLLIKSVLQTYNPLSPYVALSDWEGIACYDCGYVVHGDEYYYCEICDHDFCCECFSSCAKCHIAACRCCLKTCPVCELDYCESCLSSCVECDTEICESCLEDDLCPTCKKESEASDEEESISAENEVA